MNIGLKSNSYSKGIVVGALLGGAVSGIAALLFAPKKGSKLRRDIAEKSTDMYNDVHDKVSKLTKEKTEQLSSRISNGKHKIEAMLDADSDTAKEHGQKHTRSH